MLYTNKEKVFKQNPNYSSIPSSPCQTESTTKKKMFARKPANVVGCLPSDKKKSILQDSNIIASQIRSITENYRNSTPVGQTNETKVGVRPVELFPATEKKQPHLARYRDLFFSPKSDKNLLAGTLGFISRKQSKNHTESKDQDPSFRNSFAIRRDPAPADHDSVRKSWKFKTNSVQSFLPLKPDQQNSETITSTKSIIDKSITNECSYCLNHKKRADIVTERYTKLEEQFNLKVEIVKELTEKCEALAKEKAELCKKLEASIEKLQVKEQEFFKMREDLTVRIDSHKKEIIRLTEASKYSDIEKSMLLRFKNDYHSTLRECELLKYENDQYKKQIIALANRAHGYHLGKHHMHSPDRSHPSDESSPRQFSKKNQNGALIYYDCEDDAVSLSFSQHSLDYA